MKFKTNSCFILFYFILFYFIFVSFGNQISAQVCGSLELQGLFCTPQGATTRVVYNNPSEREIPNFEVTVTFGSNNVRFNEVATMNSLEPGFVAIFNSTSVTLKKTGGTYSEGSIDIGTIFFYLENVPCTNINFGAIDIGPFGLTFCGSPQNGVPVTNLGNVCPETVALNGIVERLPEELEVGIEDVLATFQPIVENATMPDPISTTSNGLGQFGISGFKCLNYDISLSEGNTPFCGGAASTFDIILIRKHILGNEAFTEPWQVIAADADNSGTITTADLIAIRKEVLAFEQLSPQWKFIPENHYNDIDLIEGSVVTPIYNDILRVNATNNIGFTFYGIRLGDVNGTHCFFQNNKDYCNGVDSRKIILTSEPVSANGNFSIAVNVQNFTDQTLFSMGFNIPANVTITGITGDRLPDMNADLDVYKVRNGGKKIDVLWYTAAPSGYTVVENDDEVAPIPEQPLYKTLFYINGVAHQSYNNLADLVQLDYNRVENTIHRFDESSNSELGHYECFELAQRGNRSSISISEGNIKSTFSVFPNPFSEKLSINLNASLDGNASIELFDAFGKQQFHQNKNLVKGVNEVGLDDVNHLPSGVYFYKVTTNEKIFSGKLLKK